MGVDFLARPILVNWSLSYRCNFTCQHCYTRLEKVDDLDTESCMTIGRRLADFGVIGVNFGGGEPLLRKDLFPLATEFTKLGLKISMNTNGFLMTGQTADAVKKAGFERVGVSIDGAEAETHDRFRNRRGSFKKAVEAIEILMELEIPVSVSFVVNRLNWNQLESFLNLCRRLSVRTVFLHNFKGVGLGKVHQESLDLAPEEWRQVYRTAMDLKKRFSPGLTVSFDDPILACLPESRENGSRPAIKGSTCGKISLHIRPDGGITPCGFIPLVIGNALRDDLEDIWFNSPVLERLRGKEPKEKCRSCPDYEWCLGGCTARSLAATGDPNAPDPHCWVICGG